MQIFARGSSESGKSGHYSIHCHSVLHEPAGLSDKRAIIKLITASVLSFLCMVSLFIYLFIYLEASENH